jgi:cyclic pyranopterin phosphate synthase
MKRGPSVVDIGSKPVINRLATATGKIVLREETIKRIRSGDIEKGDPISTARVAAILAAKATSTIIPLCHPIPLSNIQISEQLGNTEMTVTATVKATAKTGVEMEALTAVSAALITVWDMTKQYEKDEAGQYPATSIKEIRVIEKTKESVEAEQD